MCVSWRKRRKRHVGWQLWIRENNLFLHFVSISLFFGFLLFCTSFPNNKETWIKIRYFLDALPTSGFPPLLLRKALGLQNVWAKESSRHNIMSYHILSHKLCVIIIASANAHSETAKWHGKTITNNSWPVRQRQREEEKGTPK